MSKEIRRRKKSFWVVLLTMIIVFSNMTSGLTMANEYDVSADSYNVYDMAQQIKTLLPGDEITYHYNSYSGAVPVVVYCDSDGTEMYRENLPAQNHNTNYDFTVKEYTDVAFSVPGKLNPELFKEWMIKDVNGSGNSLGTVVLEAVAYEEFGITYELNGGINSAINPDKYIAGKGVTGFEAASKEGHTFTGWFSDAGLTSNVTGIAADITGDAVVYAGFTANTYNISYVIDGVTCEAAQIKNNPSVYTYGVGVTGLAAEVKEGHTFSGWYTDASCTVTAEAISTTETGNAVLYGRFTADSYDIEYELNGGTNSENNPDSYTYGIGVTSFDKASKEGYAFEDWYLEASFDTVVKTILNNKLGNVKLYAKFVPAVYNISYKVNGESYTPVNNPVSYTYGTGVTEFLPEVKEGSTFVGWYTDASCTVTAEGISAEATGDAVVYGKFIANSTNTEKPDETNKPDDTEKPDETNKPDDTEKPDETNKPDDINKPDETDKPISSPERTPLPEGDNDKPQNNDEQDSNGGNGNVGNESEKDNNTNNSQNNNENKSEAQNKPQQTVKSTGSPKTGDNSMLPVCLSVMIVMVAAIVFVRKKDIKEVESN